MYRYIVSRCVYNVVFLIKKKIYVGKVWTCGFFALIFTCKRFHWTYKRKY